MRNILERDPSLPSLLISAHCSTIRRKAKRLESQELSAILDDLSRELNGTDLHPVTYLNSLNQIVRTLNSYSPPILPSLNSHYFFLIIRNTIRHLLKKLSHSKRLNDQEVYVLRNCALLIDHLVKKLSDVSKILHWITDAPFLDALAECLRRIDKISNKDSNRHAVKQIARLLNVFCMVQERLPSDLHRALFVRLFQPTINCLTSSNYVKLFQNFQVNAESLTEIQKLYLIKCPYFLTTYNGPHIEEAMEQVLDVMLPRYVSIFDKHIKTIQQWKRPIMRAIHNLIITIVYAEGYFSAYSYTESFRSLINHLLTILSEQTLINKIHPTSNNIETLLIDATLIVFNVLVYEPNALDYIKQQKPSGIFRQLTKTPYQSIVLNSYVMLAYTMDDNDMKTSPDDLIQLFSTTFNLLQKTMINTNRENIDRSIVQLLETLKGLAQYEQISNEIVKYGLLTFFIDSYDKLQGLSKQILLEYLWKLSFYEPIAQQLREHTKFIYSLENLPKLSNDNIPSTGIRRSNSFSNIQNSASTEFIKAIDYGIQKAANGLLWKITKESQFREKMKILNDQHKYKYDIMISYCPADKDIVHKIEQFLGNEGYSIWSERNHNNEQAMPIVAEAMENAEFILICMSDSYKRDNYCQAQAEYALISEKILLPVIVNTGYKPDGWLNTLANNQISIDFGISNFKTASELLLNEIKQQQQQRKKEIANVRRTISSSSSSTVNVDRLHPTTTYPISRSSTPGANIPEASPVTDRQQQQQQQGYNSSTSRPATPGTIYTVAPINGFRQQQQGYINSTSRPPTPGTIHTVAPITVFRQQQQTPIQPASAVAVPDSVSTNGSIAVDKQQQPTTPMEPISRSTTPGATSTIIIQQQPLFQPFSRPLSPGSTISFASDIVDKQQQQTSVQSASKSTTTNFIYTVAPIVVNQQQQTSTPSVSRSSTTNPIYSITSVVVNQRYQQQQQTVLQSVQRSSTPNSISSTPSVTKTIQRQQTPAHTASEPTMIDKQLQTSIQSVSQSTTPGANASAASATQSSVPTSDSSTTTVDINKQQKQTQTSRPCSRAFSENQLDIKQPQSNSIPSIVSTIDNKQQRQTSVYSTPKSLTSTSADIEKQQQQQQQQQRLLSQSNSRSTTPGTLVNNSSTSLARVTSLQMNGREQLRLPTEYTNRKTHNSIYRTLLIDSWRNNDVLDFLSDTHLYSMMPLCESMSGRALVHLFRMCQRKPTRLYDQLNEELRIRFKGLTLPMGSYTQFLIEMDALVGPVLNITSPMSEPNPKIVERVIFMSRPVQRRQTMPAQPIPPPSTLSSNRSQIATHAIESRATTPHNPRFTERAIYRPASNIARPYNFIIESVEESTALHDQVQRYGDHLISLDETAQEHREINDHCSN